MFLFDVFRSFLPLHNPIGFGAADFVLLAVAALLMAFILGRPWIEGYGARLARRTAWSMAALAVLPVALRLLLLWHRPARVRTCTTSSATCCRRTRCGISIWRTPRIRCTVLRDVFRVAGAFVQLDLSGGAGLALAIGWGVFGHPWAGVLLSLAAFCAFCSAWDCRCTC